MNEEEVIKLMSKYAVYTKEQVSNLLTVSFKLFREKYQKLFTIDLEGSITKKHIEMLDCLQYCFFENESDFDNFTELQNLKERILDLHKIQVFLFFNSMVSVNLQ